MTIYLERYDVTKWNLYRPRDLGYLKFFGGKSSSVKFAYQQLTYEKGHFSRNQGL